MIPLYECEDCGARVRGSSDIAPGPPDHCDECRPYNECRCHPWATWREVKEEPVVVD